MPLLPPDPNADPGAHRARERAEFARIAADLGSDRAAGRSGLARGVQDIRLRQLEFLPRDEVVALIDGLWRAEERRRQRLLPYLVAGFTLGALLFLGSAVLREFQWEPALADYRYTLAKLASAFQALGALICTGTFFMTGTSGRQKGLLRLLPLYRDARLTGAFLDALRFWDTPDRSAALRADLTDLLPRLATADAPPLEPRQWRILGNEVRHLTDSSLRSRKPLSRPDAAFACAALDALGREAARAPADAPVRDAAEGVAARVARAVAAPSPGASPDAHRWVDVRDAAEACRIRARL